MLTMEPLLGTLAEVSVNAASDADAEFVERAAIAEAERLEAIFSRFDPKSELIALRRSGVTESAELSEVVRLAKYWAARTEGAFNPAMQPITDRWSAAEARGQVPDAGELDLAVAASAKMMAQHLDLNGVAKGWIADTALAKALEVGPDTVTSAWLSLGGDLVHWGEGSVRVGIENPHRPYDNVPPLATIEVSNAALATSGSGRRWWTVGGDRFSKVIDPRTGWPCVGISSASVLASTAAAADVLATTSLVLGSSEALTLIETEGATAMFVLEDGSVIESSGWS